MKIRRILVLYKRSAYSIYFQRSHSSFRSRGKVAASELARFRKMHDAHFACLSHVENVLKEFQMDYKKVCRGRGFDPKNFNLVITVGGDGTFLEASHKIRKQLILGVNSDPSWSVGRFCAATPTTFKEVLLRLLEQKERVSEFPRLELRLKGKRIHFLNDLLFSHRNPAAMSRYSLMVAGIQEEQKSSGVWVSTAAGSSGAIKSAGGQQFAPTEEILQYKPRELYLKKNKPYILTGGVLSFAETIKVSSIMREGTIFVDGSHLWFPFDFGVTATVARSSFPLKVVGLK